VDLREHLNAGFLFLTNTVLFFLVALFVPGISVNGVWGVVLAGVLLTAIDFIMPLMLTIQYDRALSSWTPDEACPMLLANLAWAAVTRRHEPKASGAAEASEHRTEPLTGLRRSRWS
jgi:hypothetical protein